MRVIDLLNKIANDEVDIKKIKYDNQVFEYREDMLDYYCYDYDLNLMGYRRCLNEEVEIIQEDKKIEKLNNILKVDDLEPPYDSNLNKIWCETIKHHNKINEIIDKINLEN